MATKTNQDYINENRLLRKCNMEADKEISQLKKQLEEKEKELCGEYGPNSDLFYILNLPSPLEELKKVFQEGV